MNITANCVFASNHSRGGIGGHAAALLRNICRRKDSQSSYADKDGYVLFGQLEDYTGGRSNGCTSWSRPDAERIVAVVKDEPTTLYIYPESADIDAVAQAVKARQPLARAGLYWNASCLKEIGSPKFWSKQAIEPPPLNTTTIARHRRHGYRRFAKGGETAGIAPRARGPCPSTYVFTEASQTRTIRVLLAKFHKLAEQQTTFYTSAQWKHHAGA